MFPSNIGNMTLSDIVNNNPVLLQEFQTWFQTVQTVVVNKMPGESTIVPGYRTIVKWVKNKMIKEIYTRLQLEISAA